MAVRTRQSSRNTGSAWIDVVCDLPLKSAIPKIVFVTEEDNKLMPEMERPKRSRKGIAKAGKPVELSGAQDLYAFLYKACDIIRGPVSHGYGATAGAVRPTLSLCDLHPQGKGLSG